jgi:membrane-associated phospholipid phosphatase
VFHQIDAAMLLALNRGVASRPLDWLMPRLTGLHHRGWFLILVGLACVYFLWRGPRYVRVWVLCALLAVALSDSLAYRVVKKIAPRDRPCYAASATMSRAVPDVRLVAGESCPGSPSFPSNHASNMMAVGTVCWWFTRRRARWAWFLLPIVIGYTRIYLGYHYPSDVVGGWLFGGAIAAACIAVARWFLREEREGEG